MTLWHVVVAIVVVLSWAGMVVLAIRARIARDELRAEKGRADSLTVERDYWQRAATHLQSSLDGAVDYSPRPVFPRPMGLRDRR